MIVKNIFLYHLDYELQKLFALDRTYNINYVYNCFNSVTRFAYLLSANSILIPASNFFESDIAFNIINSLAGLNNFGYIKLISSSYNLNELLTKKLNQHGENIRLPNYHYKEFIDTENRMTLSGTLAKRKNSASEDIKKAWVKSIGNNSIWNEIYNLSKHKSPSKFENEVNMLPAKLGEKAYISEYIVPLLPIKKEFSRKIDNIINAFITREYILSFLNEYNAICLKEIPLIDTNLILPNDDNLLSRHISYKYFAEIMQAKKYKNRRALEYINNCSDYDLIGFKQSTFWKSIVENYIASSKNEYDNKESKSNKLIIAKSSERRDGNVDSTDIKIGIITALPKEFAAVKVLLSDSKEIYFDGRVAGNRFCIGKIKSVNNGIHMVALGISSMGNNVAAIRASNMISHFPNMESIIMTGIAGGVPFPDKIDEHVRLGDIVVSDEKGVIQYDFVKENVENTIIRCSPRPPSSLLLEAISLLKAAEYEKNFPWEKHLDVSMEILEIEKPTEDKDILHLNDEVIASHPIDKSRRGYPRAFQGAIASSNTLLKNPQKRDILREKYGVKAIEMEASGIADATWNHSIGYLVVRGICDYCDNFKNNEWQEYAASAAAAYTIALIESIPAPA